MVSPKLMPRWVSHIIISFTYQFSALAGRARYRTISADGLDRERNVLMILLGFTTCMKTVEITRAKTVASGVKPPSTWAVFMDIYRREGIAGVNKGVNAVAVRQCTNWGSR